eukprot:6212096-Pleurochrysis_carterae.AAC.2
MRAAIADGSSRGAFIGGGSAVLRFRNRRRDRVGSNVRRVAIRWRPGGNRGGGRCVVRGTRSVGRCVNSRRPSQGGDCLSDVIIQVRRVRGVRVGRPSSVGRSGAAALRVVSTVMAT